MTRPRVVVMVKAPRPGRVKTRLARDIGATAAAWWFRHQTARLLRRVSDPRWTVVLAVSPDTAVRASVWPAHLPRVPQGRGDLGDRMARFLRGTAHGPVLIIGADIPDIDARQIALALAALRGADAVMGPAEDGGYWCIGLGRGERLPDGAFADVRWSTKHAMADTLSTLPGLRIGRAARLADVDTGADLSRTRPIGA